MESKSEVSGRGEKKDDVTSLIVFGGTGRIRSISEADSFTGLFSQCHNLYGAVIGPFYWDQKWTLLPKSPLLLAISSHREIPFHVFSGLEITIDE